MWFGATLENFSLLGSALLLPGRSTYQLRQYGRQRAEDILVVVQTRQLQKSFHRNRVIREGLYDNIYLFIL